MNILNIVLLFLIGFLLGNYFPSLGIIVTLINCETALKKLESTYFYAYLIGFAVGEYFHRKMVEDNIDKIIEKLRRIESMIRKNNT